MGELVRAQFSDVVNYGSFRTVTDAHRPAVVTHKALPPQEQKPAHFQAAIADAPIVHMVGTSSADQAKAVTYATYPQVAGERMVWTVDLSGDRETEDLMRYGYVEGIGTKHWKHVSPTRLIEETLTRKDGIEKAAGLVVASMAPTEKPDDPLTTAREIHVARLMEELLEREPDVPLLGALYSALDVATAGQVPNHNFPLDGRTDQRVRKMYSSPAAQKAAAEILGDVNVHVDALLRGDDFSLPERPHPQKEDTFFNWGIKGGRHSGARARLLAASVDSKLADPDYEYPKPDEVVITGAHRATPDTLQSIQNGNTDRGARTYMGFPKVTDTTVEMVGSDRVVLGSTGGLTGPDAEKVADSVGKRWSRAETSLSIHKGDSKARTGGSVQNSFDTTITADARHKVSTDALQAVDPDSATLAQDGTVHRNVPFRAPPRAEITSGRRSATTTRSTHIPRALPAEPEHRWAPRAIVQRLRGNNS